MPFPEHDILPADKDSWLAKAVDQKLLEFTPYSFCSFYKGFTVLQIQGIQSKEYFFGNYFNGKYCGCIYPGEKFSQLQAAKICEIYMPKTLEELEDYKLKYCEEIWYINFPISQYAWIYNRVLTEVK